MQSVYLNLIPGSVSPVINVAQYDTDRPFQLVILDGSVAASLTGKTVAISGEKSDEHGFQYTENDMVGTDHVVAVSGNTVTIRTTQQMTAAHGRSLCTLTISGTSPEEVSTLNFYMEVQQSPLEGVIISDTELPDIIAQAKAQEAAAKASATKSESWAVGGTGTRIGEDTNNAKYYCEQAGGYGTDAEAWAVGKRGGVPVGPNDVTYHNNSKYYSDEASDSATAAAGSAGDASDSALAASGSASDAADSATLSESWAVGGTNTRTGEDTNNSEYWAGRSANSAATAKNEADRAEQYADFVTPHFVIANNRLYLKDDSTVDFVVANNRLYMKLAS